MRTLQALLNHTRRVLHLSPEGGSTDGRLLARFQAGDDSAFELLVWRHGPMVLNVCRRVLNDEHAAEDAFQAAFLALSAKSASIGRGDAVGSWLYRVAYRTALRARVRAARRAERERAAGLERAGRTAPDPGFALALRELRPRLEAEIDRLPAEFRTAFVLCHLEGKTNEEAARELGCPVGTIQSRLSRARARLRARLRKEGLEPETVAFAIFPRPPRAGLVEATVRAALAKKAAQMILARRTWRRLRRGALVLLLLLLIAAAGTLVRGALRVQHPVPPPALSPTGGGASPPGAACHARPVGAP